MKRILVLILSLLALGVNAQTNLGVVYVDEYVGGVQTNLFDEDPGTSISYSTVVYPSVGVIFTQPVDIDSVVVNYNNQIGGQYISTIINVLEGGNWSDPIYDFYYVAEAGTQRIFVKDLNLSGVTGIRIRTTDVYQGLDHPDWNEVEFWGSPSIATGIDEFQLMEDMILAVYNLNGRVVDIDTPGLVIVRWESGKVEKIVNL